MADIFLKGDTTSLLDNRFIVVIGDSNMRGVYKDLVLLLQKNKYLHPRQLRKKGEKSFEGDKLIEGGTFGEMSNGVNYREVRQYQTDYHLARFYFITRCYNAYMESILLDLSKEPKPDVVLLNSCLWDISRYGASSVDDYKDNLGILFKRLKETLPDNCLVVWCTTLPISKHTRGGFMIPEVAFMKSNLRLDLLEANFFVHKLMPEYGFDILDLHFHLRHQLQRRADDGVHWDQSAHRRISNLILSHIAVAWGVRQQAHQHLSVENSYMKHHHDINNNRQVENRNRLRNLGPHNVNRGPNKFNAGPKSQMNELMTLADNLARNVGNVMDNNDNRRIVIQNRNSPLLGFHGDQFPDEHFHEGQFHGEQFHEGQLHGEQFPGEQFHGEQFHGDQFHGDQFHGGQFAGEQFHGDQFHGDQFHGGQFAGEQFHDDQYISEQLDNMNRYGGPIRQPAWSFVNIPAQQLNQVHLVNDRFQWVPYQNNINNLVMKVQGPHVPSVPYARQVQMQRRNIW